MAWNTGILNDGVNVMESVTPDPETPDLGDDDDEGGEQE